MIDKFDWTKFYGQENEKIITNILDRGQITLNQILSIFFYEQVNILLNDGVRVVTQKSVIESLNEVFTTMLDEFNKTKIDPLGFMLANPEERTKVITNQDILFKADYILALLIRKQLLPLELSRLPRLTKEKIGFDIISAYYEEHHHVDLNPHDLIKIPSNFYEKPITFDYEELVKIFDKYGKPKSLIEKACKENLLGGYLNIPEQEVIIEASTKKAVQSIDYFRKMNCGNPFYLRRYRDLERLFFSDEDSNISLMRLFLHKKMSLLYGSYSYALFNHLQCTDIETKFHINREIRTFIGKTQINLNDLVFVEEEVMMFLSGQPCQVPSQSLLIKDENDQQKTSSQPQSIVVADMPRMVDSAKKTRMHELHSIIKRAYEALRKQYSRDPINTELWKVLQNTEYDQDEIIQEMTNQKILWINYKGNERTMARKTFMNQLSKLRKSKFLSSDESKAVNPQDEE